MRMRIIQTLAFIKMSIYIRYLIATLFCLFVSMFMWASFMEASLFELSTGSAIIESGNPPNSNLYILQLAIGSIPILVLITTLLNKQTTNLAIVVTSLTILATGILTWQARIIYLNLKIKRMNYIMSLADNEVVNSIQLDRLLLEHYFAAGLVIGAIFINVYYYRNGKRMVT